MAAGLTMGVASITLALDFLSDPHAMYVRADEETEKHVNDAIFERVHLRADRITDVTHTEPLRAIKVVEQERQVVSEAAQDAPGRVVASVGKLLRQAPEPPGALWTPLAGSATT